MKYAEWLNKHLLLSTHIAEIDKRLIPLQAQRAEFQEALNLHEATTPEDWQEHLPEPAKEPQP